MKMNTRQNNFKLIKITWEICMQIFFMPKRSVTQFKKKRKRRGTLHAVLHLPGGAEQLQMK
jgi:hypothetical protein